jgi:GcrA cell cycle regulator
MPDLRQAGSIRVQRVDAFPWFLVLSPTQAGGPVMSQDFEWTLSAQAKLVELWKSGLSAEKIRQEMGLNSRGAVLGKLHRLGCTGKSPNAPERVKKIAAQPKTRRPCVAAKPKGCRKDRPVAVRVSLMRNAAIFPIQMNPTRFADLERDQCRFPIDDVNAPGTAETLFCGAKQDEDSSYCAHHHARCMSPYKRSRKRFDRSKINSRDRFVFGVAA